MKKLNFFVVLIFFFSGCGEEEKTTPAFPEIENPLNQIDVLQRTLNEAVEISDLIVNFDIDFQIHRNPDGSLFSGWIKKSYPNGKVGFLFHCRNGLQDGLHTAWFENGKKMVERSWKNGIREGPFKNWSAAGILESRGYNKNNLRDGLCEEFYDNGNKKSEITYKAGKIDLFSRWKPDGTACPDTLVQGGTGIVINYNDNGSADSNVSYYMGELDYGRSNDFNQNNTLNEASLSLTEDLNSSILPNLKP